MEKDTFTVTAALPYANGPLHLGHIAGVYLPADIFVRFLRMKEHDVAFICGSDEHGAAITLRAKKEGISPQEIVDKYHDIIKNSFHQFHIDFDIFHRTSLPIHHETSGDFFKKLEANGSFTKENSEQYYDEEYKQFLADRYITGTCPKCQNDNAYGDQCEKCGSDLSPTELIDPKSTLSGKTPILKATSHWYLPMNDHEEWLREWIQNGILDGEKQHDPKKWRNQVIGQCMSWINGGLKPRAMTRDLDWGVTVPWPDAEGKVLYVWLDAPIGYISATKQWAKDNNLDWKKYWCKPEAGNRKLIHFIGKDNIVFHAIIFPILLKSHGDFILPENVPAYEFLNLEGDKFSTSRNWAVWLHEYLAAYPNKVDELKYVLTSIAPESKDSEFTWKEYQQRINSELADVYGNFVNRTLVLSQKYYNGIVPQPLEFSSVDEDVLATIEKVPAKISALIYAYKIREAQSEMMQLARIGNKYLADQEPWKVIKTDPTRVQTVIYVALQITNMLSVVTMPFLSVKAKELQEMLQVNYTLWPESPLVLDAGHQLGTPKILFEKIEDELVMNEKAKLETTIEQTTKYPKMKDAINFDDFAKLDMRMGKIISAQKVEKADKLLHLIVDTGIDQRTIVSGIAEHFSPEEVIGKTVLVLLNLEPRKIRGVESQGMILMAENEDGKLSFLSAENDFGPGPSVG